MHDDDPNVNDVITNVCFDLDFIDDASMICDLDAEPTNKDFEFNQQNEKGVKIN